MAEVSIWIDGKKVTVEEGMTILEAAQKIGIEIPHLCYEERLAPLASCRLCLVEVKGVENLVASCSYPVKDGMEVKTLSLIHI